MNDPNLSDTFTFHVLTQPANGTAVAVNSHTELQYTPNPGFTGTDSFNFRARDQAGNFVNGKARFRVYDPTTALTKCTRDGSVKPDPNDATLFFIDKRPKSNDCAFYASTKTRLLTSPTSVAKVTMDFFVNWPSDPANTPKAVVVLIGGGDLDMGLAQDTAQGAGIPLETGGGNFVIRTAQIFAEAGYMTIAIDKPSDLPPSGTNCDTSPAACDEAADRYRVSVNHAVDILKILKHYNTRNLPVFLAGTSRGAISSVAANLIATGISLSSPVTNNSNDPAQYYVGDSAVPNLAASSVQRPSHVLWNTQDLCAVSPPTGTPSSQSIATDLGASSSALSGGVEVTASPTDPNDPSYLPASSIGPCQPYDYHGFFGIDNTAVDAIAAWLDGQVSAFGGGSAPRAGFRSVNTPSGAAKQTNLANLTGGVAGLTYGLAYPTSSLGGTVTLSGTTATYTPPPGASNQTDYYVYFVKDAAGRVGAAVVTVNIGP